jgi:hypothetical protein
LNQHVIDVLIVILQDRNVNRVESEPRPPSKKWKRSGFYHSAQDVTETTLYCPRRISTADHGGTHASPRMHYRAEHTKMQPAWSASQPAERDHRRGDLGQRGGHRSVRTRHTHQALQARERRASVMARQIAQLAANEKYKKTFDREYKARFEKQLALAAAEHDPD